MSATAVQTNTTCSEACWHAHEDVCRCSCGGRNHGCLKTGSGEQPVRTCLIDGVRYKLEAVSLPAHLGGAALERQAYEMNKAEGCDYLFAATSRDSMYRYLAAKLRVATPAQVDKWPELKAASEQRRGIYGEKVLLLWVRVDARPQGWKL